MIAAIMQQDGSMVYNSMQQPKENEAMSNTSDAIYVRAYAFPADAARQGFASPSAADMCARLADYGIASEIVFDADAAMEYITIPESETKMLAFLKRMAPGKFSDGLQI